MKKTVLIIFILLSSSFLCVAENSSLDSLLNILQYSKEDTLKAQLFNEIAKKYWINGDYENAIRHIKLSDNLSQKINYKIGQANAKNALGLIYMDKGDFQLSLYYHKLSLDIREKIKNKKGTADSYNNIGLIYDYMGNYPQALDYYYKALKLYEFLNLEDRIANIYNNIGLIYQNQAEFNDAIQQYSKAMELYKKYDDIQGLATIYNNWGNIYTSLNDFPKALDYHKLSLQLKEKIGDAQGIATSYNNIGGIYRSQNKLTLALENFFISYQMFATSEDKQGLSGTCNNLGITYMRLGKYPESKKYLEMGLKISTEIGFIEEIKLAYEGLAVLDSSTGNFRNAFENYKMAVLLRDSLNNENNSRKSIQQHLQYDFDKKTTADSIKAVEHRKVLNAQIEKEKTQKYALYGGLFLVVVFLGFVYNRLQVTRKQRNIITEQKEVVEKAHHELEEKNHEILQSINYAKRLQQSILPPPRLVKEYMKDSFVLYMPKDIVAGDFYWIESHNNKIYFAAADCTGHGVPGAMVSMVCHNALNRALLEFGLQKPSLILDKASEIVEETFSKSEDNVQDGMDISLFCLDTQTRELEWAGANNPLWMIKPHPNPSPEERGDSSPLERLGEVIEIKPDKQPVGRYENRKLFTNHTIQLNEGDSLFSITDGYPDQFGGQNGKKYTYKKLREFLLSINNKPMTIQKDELIAEFEKWRGNNEQVDDICIIGVRI